MCPGRLIWTMQRTGEENYEVKVMLTAMLSCDHMVVDGAVGAQWLILFKAVVENLDVLLS